MMKIEPGISTLVHSLSIKLKKRERGTYMTYITITSLVLSTAYVQNKINCKIWSIMCVFEMFFLVFVLKGSIYSIYKVDMV